MTDQPELTLPEFEGREVIASRVRITGAGEGLSDSLDLEPEALHYGEKRFFVIESEVTQVNHRTDKKSGKLVREHTAQTQNIAEIDPETAAKMLAESDERKRRLRREQAEEQGIHELPYTGEAPDGEVDDDDTGEVEDGVPAEVDPEADPGETGQDASAAFSGGATDWDYPQPDPQPAEPAPVEDAAPKSGGRRRRGGSAKESTDGS